MRELGINKRNKKIEFVDNSKIRQKNITLKFSGIFLFCEELTVWKLFRDLLYRVK